MAHPQPGGAQLGPDVAPEWLAEYDRARQTTPYKHTVLLATATPANLSPEDAAIVDSLPRVTTLRQLQTVLTDDINLIVVDASAAGEVKDTGFLYNQIEARRAVIELNVCFDEVHVRGPYPPQVIPAGQVTEIAPDGTVRRTEVALGATPLNTCALPLAGGQVPFFAYRRLATARELAEYQWLGRGTSNESMVNLNLAPGALKIVVTRLDAAAEGNALPLTCDQGRMTGLEHFVCPDVP